MTDAPEQTVGSWTLHERLGRGGNAIVWLATRPGSPSPVALKLTNTTKVDKEPYRRFVREIGFLQDHQSFPGVLPLVDAHLPEQPIRRTLHGWRCRRASEPDLAGASDRALLLVGFVGALRRAELVALDWEDVNDHPQGLVVTIPRSKTNQEGTEPELVVLPLGPNPARCPVRALRTWAEAAEIASGPVFRPVSTGNKAVARRLSANSVNYLVQAAIKRAGIDPLPYSVHSLRAGFVTYAHLRGASDRAIAHQTRHRSLATLGQ